MFKFLRNKLLTTFMIFGALTQTSWAKENHTREDKASPNVSLLQKVDKRYLQKKSARDREAEARRIAADDTEELTIMGIARDKNWLERIISLEFAARYEDVAERAMMTKDKTELIKIRAERDEIMARRQKEWDEGTFDQVAEAKRWAAYLKKRAIDQTLVNYPVYIGEPPFPIDMSVLDSEMNQETAKAKTPAPFSPDEIIVKNNTTPLAGTEDVQELLNLLDDQTVVPGFGKIEEVPEKQLAQANGTTPVSTVASSTPQTNGMTETISVADAKADSTDSLTPQAMKEELEKLLQNLDKNHDEPAHPTTIAETKSTNQDDLQELLSNIDDAPVAEEKKSVAVAETKAATQNDADNLQHDTNAALVVADKEPVVIAENTTTTVMETETTGQADMDELLRDINDTPVVEEKKPMVVAETKAATQNDADNLQHDTDTAPVMADKEPVVTAESRNTAQDDLEELLNSVDGGVPLAEEKKHISSDPVPKKSIVKSNSGVQKDLADLLDAFEDDNPKVYASTSVSKNESSKKIEEQTEEKSETNASGISTIAATEATTSSVETNEVATAIALVQVPEAPKAPVIQIAQNAPANSLPKIEEEQTVITQSNGETQKDLNDLLNAIERDGMEADPAIIAQYDQKPLPPLKNSDVLDFPKQSGLKVSLSPDDIDRMRAKTNRDPDDPEDIDLNSPYTVLGIFGFGVAAFGALLTSASRKHSKEGIVQSHLNHHTSHSTPLSGSHRSLRNADLFEADIAVADTKIPVQEKTEITVADTKDAEQETKESVPVLTSSVLPSTPIQPIQHRNDMSQDDREFLATRLHAIREMEDIKRERYKLIRQMAKAKADDDTDQIKAIEDKRHALTLRRKAAFAIAAGPLLEEIKNERRLLAKEMTKARRRKEQETMETITQKREQLKLQEQVLKSVVRNFKYKQERTTFLKPVLVSKIQSNPWRKKAHQHTRV